MESAECWIDYGLIYQGIQYPEERKVSLGLRCGEEIYQPWNHG